jgi:predicted nucleotidyltransferase
MKILIKAVAGSHLFGTSTPESDMDYKGVYVPSSDEILLGNYSDTRQSSTGDNDSKNSKDDIDIELYSVKKFMKMVSRGDTAALELLFTPEDLIIEKDPLWDEILKHRDKFLSKSISSMIGYARQQANKYGIKGSRMGELSNAMKALKEIEKETKGPKMKHGWEKIQEALKGFQHVHFIMLNAKHEGASDVPALDILGKKFDYHCEFSYVLEILKRIYKNYGQRARQAQKNNGIDWKALSHAMRVCLQGTELLEKHTITLPLPSYSKNMVLNVKCGKVEYKDVEKNLELLLDNLEIVRENSTLPKKVDQEFLNKLIIDIHKKVIDK